MLDPRVQKLAAVIAGYSTPVQSDDVVVIRANTLAVPLVRALYAECLKLGAHPELLLTIPDLEDTFYLFASDSQLGHTPPVEHFVVERSDAHIAIISPENTRTLSQVSGERQSLRRNGRMPVIETFDRRELAGELRWALTLFPTNALAQDAGMSLREYEDFVYTACKVDQDDPVAAWQEQGRKQQRLVERLTGSSTIRIVAPDTDLTFSVAGRTWLNADGRRNLPDGEVYVAPLEDSAEGHIRFSYPAIESNVVVEDVQLWFSGGKVVRATASKHEDFLHAMLNIDEGARRIGEFAFGMNDGITRHTGNVLLDEKIGGTVHLALGSTVTGSEGVNESGLHWDIVTDLRAGGEVWVDGVLLQKDGVFVV